MRPVILPSACEDLAEGFAFYEKQSEGLGIYFLESLFSDIDSLRLYAGVHRRVFGLHRLLSKRFPFAVYYDHNADGVLVHAILDCRRDPLWIRQPGFLTTGRVYQKSGLGQNRARTGADEGRRVAEAALAPRRSVATSFPSTWARFCFSSAHRGLSRCHQIRLAQNLVRNAR